MQEESDLHSMAGSPHVRHCDYVFSEIMRKRNGTELDPDFPVRLEAETPETVWQTLTVLLSDLTLLHISLRGHPLQLAALYTVISDL